MAITAARPTVTSTASLIATNSASSGAEDTSTLSFLIRNVTGTSTIYLGPSGVTTSDGVQWLTTDGPLSIDLEPGESLYGIVAATTQTLHVLGGGR